MLRSLGLGLGLETFAKFLRVSVSVSKNLVSEKKSRFRFRKNLVSEKSLGFGFGKFGLGRKVSVSVSEKFGLGKSLGFGFGKFGIVKKVSVSVSVKILVSSFSVEKGNQIIKGLTKICPLPPPTSSSPSIPNAGKLVPRTILA